MIRFFVLFLFLIPVCCVAQFKISGRITSHEEGKPVANASIFLADATIGAKSSADGDFLLAGVKPGQYQLVVSIIGYQTYTQTLLVTDGNIVLPNIKLFTKTIAIAEVTVKFDHNREKNLQLFEAEFLGTSDLAKSCKILNPETLNLDYDNAAGTLTASADDFLIIENDALGYKINYLLKDFRLNVTDPDAKEIHYDGLIFFTKMDGTTDQQVAWKRRRQDVYENSIMHFNRSLIKNRLEQEGFGVYRIAIRSNPERPPDSVINAKISLFKHSVRDSLAYWKKKSRLPELFQTIMRYPMAASEVLSQPDTHGNYALSCAGDALYVVYNKNHHYHVEKDFNHLDVSTTDATVLNFAAPEALIDANGSLINPNNLMLNGAWVRNRIAEQLPSNYEPEENKDAELDSAIAKSIEGKIKKYSGSHLTEKAYLHFDKPYYAAGDTIYFKAYITDGDMHLPSPLSGVLHVNLADASGKTDQAIKLKLNNGLAWGEFALPDSMAHGYCKVTAYTELMRNSPQPAAFSQIIPVWTQNKVRTPESGVNLPSTRPSTDGDDLQFFPEGGKLVVGLRSKIAFKAIGSDGLGVDVSGIITNNEGRRISSFTSSHLGMGYFYIEPEAGQIYAAHVTYANGSTKTITLPVADLKGVVLSVDDNTQDNKVSIKIAADKATCEANKNETFTLLVYSGGEVTPVIFKLDKPVVSLDLEKSDFHSGIARITLFSPAGEPLSERLIFLRNKDLMDLSLVSDKKIYTKRGKVLIKLNAADDSGRPVMGHFSISVTNETKFPIDDNAGNSILSNLLLTSDLKGYVEQPNYYFAGAAEANANLDILLLTQGYRKFEWKQVLNNTSNSEYRPEKLLKLSGELKTDAGKPVPYGKIVLLAAKSNLLRDTLADANGNFTFTDLNLSDTSVIVLRAKTANGGNNVKIVLASPDEPTFNVRNNEPAAKEIPQAALPFLQRRYEQTANQRGTALMLKEVKIKGYKTPAKPVITNSANLNGPGNADDIIMGDELVNCFDPSCLYGKIPNTIVKNGKLFRSSEGDQLGENQGFPPPAMVIIIDGMVFEQKQNPFEMISVSNIYSIEVLTSLSYLSIYGTDAPGGALVITTKRGGEKGTEPTVPSGLTSLNYRGFYKSREFYSPKYERITDHQFNKDLRPTIYWDPELLTNSSGSASFDYFNSDDPGTYQVVVEGIDDAGAIGRQVYYYTVE